MNSTLPSRPSRCAAFRLIAGLLVAGLFAAPVRAETAENPPSAAVANEPLVTIDEALTRALQHNQRIKVSDFGRGIGRANVLAEYGRFDPALTFKRSYNESESATTTGIFVPGQNTTALVQTDNYSLTLDGLTPWGASYEVGGWSQNQRGSYNRFSDNFVTFGGVSVTQPLLRGFGFGANLVNLRIAKADRSISDWEYRQMVIDTVTNVIIAYNDVAEARENLRIALRSRDLATQLVHDNERRNRVGSISDADVTQARARAAIREESILFARRQVIAQENRLREYMGDAAVAPDAPLFAVSALTPVTTPTMDGAADYRRALELRPDYQAAKLGIVKARAQTAYARNQIWPRVDFVGSYGYNGVDPSFARSRTQVRNEDNRAYSAGVVVSVPLTFAASRGRARAAKLTQQQSEADLVRLEQDIALSVANAIGTLETAGERVQATARAYELAQQALDAEEKRFRAGTSSTFLVLQLQDYLTQVQSNQVRAVADQRRALAAYEREIGTTLISHGMTLQ